MAGFETSSTTLTFALYELALNVNIQETLQKEIEDLFTKNNNKITYEGVMGMEYLDCVVHGKENNNFSYLFENYNRFICTLFGFRRTEKRHKDFILLSHPVN